MAPEVFKRNYCNKVDIWSLGVCGYEMISFGLPFANEADICNVKIPYKKLPSDNHPTLVPLVHQMLNRDVRDRPSATKILETISHQKNPNRDRVQNKSKQGQESTVGRRKGQKEPSWDLGKTSG